MIPINRKKISLKRLKQLKRYQYDTRYQEWRKYVLHRDGNQCQMAGCSCKDDLEVHHIKRYADNPHLRTETLNGITLCDKHHKDIYGKEKQYEIYFLQVAQANENKNNS